jgi:hypothetical protein
MTTTAPTAGAQIERRHAQRDALTAVEPVGLCPCPACGAWQWIRGLTDYRRAWYGDRGGPPPWENVRPQA